MNNNTRLTLVFLTLFILLIGSTMSHASGKDGVCYSINIQENPTLIQSCDDYHLFLSMYYMSETAKKKSKMCVKQARVINNMRGGKQVPKVCTDTIVLTDSVNELVNDMNEDADDFVLSILTVEPDLDKLVRLNHQVKNNLSEISKNINESKEILR